MHGFEQRMVAACNRPVRNGFRRLTAEMPWGQDFDEWMASKPTYAVAGEHQLGYDPAIHHEGKGFLTTNGSVWTWPTHHMRPQHLEYNMKVKRLGLGSESPFHIQNGQVYTWGPGRGLTDELKAQIQQADPRLDFLPANQVAPAVQNAPAGFGHGRNVLDILDR